MDQDPLMKTRLHRCAAAFAAVGLSALVLSACGGAPSANKSGASVHKSVTLRLEMPDTSDALGAFFAKAVRTRSRGSVEIQVDIAGYPSCIAAHELKLAHALESGRADIGYLAARAWAADGRPAFKALLAPFVVTTDRTAQSLAAGPVATEVLQTLPSSVVGLGLVPAEPRRVLAVRSPLTPGAFAGLRIRIVDDPQTAADFNALRAHPVQGVGCQQVFPLLRDHKIDATESDTNAILNNGYFGVAHYLSAYSMFPKFQSIVITRRVWDRLSGGQRSALRAAVADTVAAAPRLLAREEANELIELCEAQVRVVVPSATQLRVLVAAAKPAVTTLAHDPTASRVLDAIRGVPGAGPQRTASALPSACH
jgi:TRAP-type C4-dicarboxylate transport system substrate-binding protein